MARYSLSHKQSERADMTDQVKRAAVYYGVYSVCIFIVLWGIRYHHYNGYSPLVTALVLSSCASWAAWQFRNFSVVKWNAESDTVRDEAENVDQPDSGFLDIAPRLVPPFGFFDEETVAEVCYSLSLNAFDFKEKNVGLHPKYCGQLRKHWLKNNVLVKNPSDARLVVFTMTGRKDVESAADEFKRSG